VLKLILTVFVSGALSLSLFGPAEGQAGAAQLVDETTVRINPATIQRGQNGVVSIDLVARGGQHPENAVAFSISFDPGQLSFVMAAPGTGAQGAQFSVNSAGAASGQLGIIIARNPGDSFIAGTQQIAVLTFGARANASAASTPIDFSNVPVPLQVVDVNAQQLTANWLNGAVTITDSCVYSISPSVANFSSKHGAGTVNVTAGANCPWDVITDTPWIVLTGALEGTGNGMVTFEVSSNDGINRAGSILIAGHIFTVRQGADFHDVAADSEFHEFIGKASAAGITVGCTADGMFYCPDRTVTREQMAAFILRSVGEFNPPPPALQRFVDVSPMNTFYSFIDQIAERGITVGCNPQGTMYCPSQAVTREQMAAFIIRALGEFNPPNPAQQRFLDVPPTSPFYGFIDQMARRGITLGCNLQGTLYCPNTVVTREQMAAFLVRAFGL
jgi:S-layer homology domain